MGMVQSLRSIACTVGRFTKVPGGDDAGASVGGLVKVPTGSVDRDEIVGVNGERTFHEAIVWFVLDAVEFDQRVADLEAVLDQGQQFRLVGQHRRAFFRHGRRGPTFQESVPA